MRVIIADDELHVRRRLQEKIDWSSLGVSDLVLCSDGDEILEALEEKEADLVLTDIRMARMDGIRAVREAKKRFPHLFVILMSAYDDKEYLKSALELQVLGYLEKPFTIAAAQEIISRAVREIASKRQASSAVGFAMREQRKIALEEMAGDLCRYQPDGSALVKRLEAEYPEFAAANSYYVLMLQKKEEDPDLNLDNRTDVCQEILEEQQWHCLFAKMKRGELVVLLAQEPESINSRLERLAGLLRVKSDGNWMIAVGSHVQELTQIYRSYRDAAVTMERHFYHSSPILYFEETRTEPAVFTEEGRESFIFALRSRNAAACISCLENLKQLVLEHDSTLVRATKNYYFQLALLILEYRVDQGTNTVSEYYLWELFYQMNSLDSLHGFLLELLNVCLPGQTVYEKGRDQITSILQYIDAHLQNPGLSLTEISRAYYMSVTYLCMYFKEKTGTTIKSYIIDSRMKKAAELLVYTDLKVAEIAEAVGFTDQSYFTKSFSRYYGKSPSRYKEEAHETDG